MFKKQWKDVSAFALAQAVFDTVQGDCTRLHESFKSDSSVWQEMSTRALGVSGHRFRGLRTLEMSR